MTLTARAALSLALVTPLTGAQASATDFVDPSALYAADLQKFWQLQLPVEAGARIRDVYLVDDAIYATSTDGYAFAVHARTGALRWIRPITPAYRIPRPCHVGDNVIFALPPFMVQFSRVIGQPVRKFDLGFPSGTGATTDGENVFIGGLDRRFYSYHPRQEFESWKVALTRPVVSQPCVHDGVLFAADQSGLVVACRAANKQRRWVARTSGPVTADLVADENGVYVASDDQSLWLFDLVYGEEKWRARLSSPLFEPPVITRDTAYQFSALDGIVAINTGTLDVKERLRWTLPRGRSVLTVDEQHVYALSRDQTLLKATRDKGEVVAEIPAPGFTFFIPSPADGALYIASADGRLFCARAKGVPYLQVADLRKALVPQKPQTAAAAAAEAATAGATAPLSERIPSVKRPPLGGRSKISRSWTGDAPAPNAGDGKPAEEGGSDEPADPPSR